MNKLELPLPKDALCQVYLILALWFLRKFFKVIGVFSFFHNHLRLKNDVVLYWKKLNRFYPKMVCAKFGWNLLSVSEEENENVKSLRQLQEDEEVLKLLSQLS